MLALRHSIIRASLPVASLLVHLGAPPLEVLGDAGVDEAEKDNDDAKGKARVESGAESHGVLAPPGVMAVLDDVVEDVADEYPDGKVETCRGRDPRHGAKDDGEVDLAEDALALTSAVEPEGNREEGAKREEPDQGTVDGLGAKELVGTNHTPEDRAVEVNSSNGAGETIDGLRGTDALDIGKHPVENANLRQGGDECRHELDGEEDTGRDLHVMAQLEIRRKFDALG